MGGDTTGYSVLHVDDDPNLTSLTSDIGSDIDNFNQYDAVNDPKQALEYIEKGCYDAVISDIEMPSMTGLELLENVEEENCGIPFVFYSNRDDMAEEIYAEARDEAMVDFVEKDDIVNDFTELRHSVVQTADYSRKVNEVRELKGKAYDLVSNLRHDMLNPLSVAKGYAEELDRYCDDSEIPFDIDSKVTSQLERVEELIDDAVQLAEGVNISEDELETVNLNEVAEDSWNYLDPKDENGISPEINIRNLGEVKADESRLKNLFTNLYCNSVDHSGKEINQLEVEVGELPVFETSTRAPTESKGIYIEDNGQGIPKYRRDEIFLQGVTTLEDHTGYGLPTAKETAEQHGWEIQVTESKKGGARFEIKFR